MRFLLKEIPDFPEYKIARDGRLYSVRRKKFVKPRYDGFKLYPRYELWRKGKRYVRWCHRLVATVWLGDPTDKNVHHKDGDALNFHADNLTILTPQEHREAHRKIRARINKERAEKLKEDCPF